MFPLFYIYMDMEDIKQQLDQWYSNISGKIFQDGPYEYLIYINLGDSMVNEPALGINIVIKNIPGHIGGDLLVYTMGHIMEAGGDVVKNMNAEWLIGKIIIKEMDNLGDMHDHIAPTVNDFLSFQELNKKILNNKDKKIDLFKIFEVANARISKLSKALDYLKESYKPSIEAFQPISIKYKIDKHIRFFNNTIVPGVSIIIYLYHSGLLSTAKIQQEQTIKDEIISLFKEITPIDINKYDALNVAFNRSKLISK